MIDEHIEHKIETCDDLRRCIKPISNHQTNVESRNIRQQHRFETSQPRDKYYRASIESPR